MMAFCFENSKVVAIDAGIEGKDNMLGIDLTNKIAKEEKLNCCVEYGFSPEDTPKIIKKHFQEEKMDLVFIDGLHTNEQLLKDFYGIKDFCHQNTLFFYHDIINWKMENAFEEIKKNLTNYESILLYRTTSGMGVSIPRSMSSEVKQVIYAFSENSEYISLLKKSLTKKARIKPFIAKFLPSSVKKKIKELLR